MAERAVQRVAERVAAEHGRWVEWAGRFGFATKGLVFGVIGAMAAGAAWGEGRTEGSKGAIQAIGRQPFGQALLWITAAGLAGYALWRFVQAALDPEHPGFGWKNVLRRIGFAAIGGIYTGLAIYAAPFSIIGGSGPSERSFAAKLLTMPGGSVILGAVGALVIGVACFELYLAFTQKFMRQYQVYKMKAAQRKIAKAAGVVGLTARSVTFFIAGVFTIVAAYKLDPNQTKGFGEALQVLADQPYGPWLLALAGVGLMCYAVYCGTQACYRRFAISE